MTTIKHNAGGRSPGENDVSGDSAPRTKPTDMELMLYFDGELDEARREEVEAYIQRDTATKRKLSGLRVASGIVRERALAPDISFDIAASVMSAIDSGVDAQGGKGGGGSKPVVLSDGPRAMAERSAPANDNSRGIFRLAAIAVAAAAAMMIWGRMGSEPARSVDNSPPATTQAAPAPPSPVITAEEAAPAEAPSADGESEHGVEVAAVDFGAHMGTIFYVPTGAAVSNSTTTVVWVDDEVAGGK